ncbi:MAG: chromate efflux transporter [Opitutaceae bacterium]|nr:chromate efflux transporter [Opitutaceae bacterium]
MSASPDSTPASAPVQPPSFREALAVWIKIGLLSFGGPSGQIALMHQELVDKRRWISDGRFLHALNYCMLLPGPEAQQLSIYIGWLLHRTWGGIVAGTLFVLPGAFLLWLVSYIYVAYGQVPWIDAIFYGLKPAVMGIVAFAVLRIGKKALKSPALWSIAAAAFIGIFFLKLPFPLIVGSAALIGLIGYHLRPDWFFVPQGHAPAGTARVAAVIDDDYVANASPSPALSRAFRTLALWGSLWAAPLVLIAATLGTAHVLYVEGLFFSKAAVVTFGGAYAVLPYVAQQAVETHGWLTQTQMLDGLGLAETTPGPLILVLQFVGFLGAWGSPETFSPLVAATLGAALTTWVTFVPSFLFIFLGAPYIEALRGSRPLGCALSAITAGVVGVILNLAVWFSLGVLFPSGASTDWFAVAVAVAVFFGLHRLKWDTLPVVAACGLLGLVYRLWLVPA